MLETESDEMVSLFGSPRKAIGDSLPMLNECSSIRSSFAAKKKEPPIIKLEGVDVRKTGIAFQRLKIAESSCTILAVMGFGCFAIGNDVQYTTGIFDRKSQAGTTVLILGTISTVLLAFAIVWRIFLEFRWDQARCNFSIHDTFFTAKKHYVVMREFLIIWPHPMLWLEGYTFTHYTQLRNSDPGLDEYSVEYPINSILSVWSLLRLYYILRLIFIQTMYSSSRAQRVCRMNGGEATTMFALRCLMRESPFELVACMLVFAVLCGSFAIRIFERPMSPYSGMDFASYQNTIWYVLVTITTVGFGDYYAVTIPGRVIAFVVCLWGVIIVSIMVCFVASILGFDPGETRALDILQRLAFRAKMRSVAAFVLTAGLRYCLIAKHHPEKLPDYVLLLGKFRKYVNDFETLRVSQRKIMKLDTWQDKMERKVKKLARENSVLQSEILSMRSIVEDLRDQLKEKKSAQSAA